MKLPALVSTLMLRAVTLPAVTSPALSSTSSSSSVRSGSVMLPALSERSSSCSAPSSGTVNVAVKRWSLCWRARLPSTTLISPKSSSLLWYWLWSSPCTSSVLCAALGSSTTCRSPQPSSRSNLYSPLPSVTCHSPAVPVTVWPDTGAWAVAGAPLSAEAAGGFVLCTAGACGVAVAEGSFCAIPCTLDCAGAMFANNAPPNSTASSTTAASAPATARATLAATGSPFFAAGAACGASGACAAATPASSRIFCAACCGVPSSRMASASFSGPAETKYSS